MRPRRHDRHARMARGNTSGRCLTGTSRTSSSRKELNKLGNSAFFESDGTLVAVENCIVSSNVGALARRLFLRAWGSFLSSCIAAQRWTRSSEAWRDVREQVHD